MFKHLFLPDMNTYHLHITGMVQGVGFRPLICQLAEKMKLSGWVSNTTDGLHAEINADPKNATEFCRELLDAPPSRAIITGHAFTKTSYHPYSGFEIRQEKDDHKPNLLLTPDIALCDDCRADLHETENRRFHYPFTTCLNCGPRYSILRKLPYEREHTTMAEMAMCPTCKSEYHDILQRRHLSQTNSCPDCRIKLHFYTAAGEIHIPQDNMIDAIASALNDQQILAVKGIGGYLLLGLATDASVIQTLRQRKHRPGKPFAVLYPDLASARKDVYLTSREEEALRSPEAPIVLCRKKEQTRIHAADIAPGLDRIGVMLPYTPLLELIAQQVQQPLIATSANVSGSPILFEDNKALQYLFSIADAIITYDRDILIPQDDSVVQFTEHGHRIILRRARGMAPNYIPHPFIQPANILAMGAELKSAFALQTDDQVYVSQYLGNQADLESMESYMNTLAHLRNLLQFKPEVILADSHPSYFISEIGSNIAMQASIPLHQIQHHKAHFGAILAEYDLLKTEEPVLGIIWDGTGYGEDGQIWGSEIFRFQQGNMERMFHLDYFPVYMGDKMSREPRLSALSLLHAMPEQQNRIRDRFSESQWEYYQKMIAKPAATLTSSMGRFLDGIACLLGLTSLNLYEGHAAMLLETAARRSALHTETYPLYTIGKRIIHQKLLICLLQDLDEGKSSDWIAQKIFNSLIHLVNTISNELQTNQIAFSGGVFQNAFLVEKILSYMGSKKALYFHRFLSPNDECISFGQLAVHQSLITNH